MNRPHLAPAPRPSRGPTRRSASEFSGFVLVSVLVLVMMLSMVTVSLLFRLQAEDHAIDARDGAEQAWSVALSGIRDAMQVAAHAEPGSTDWQEDANAFHHRFVFDDGSQQWHYTIYSAPEADALVETRYGLSDEASRLHVAKLDQADLSRLTSLAPTLATTLREAFAPRPGPPSPTEGALDRPLTQPLGSVLSAGPSLGAAPFDATDALLRLPGFSPATLYGEDANFNLRLDPNENDGDERFPPDNSDGKLQFGLHEYLTAHAYDPNRALDGTPRISLRTLTNSPSLPPAVPAHVSEFLQRWRQSGKPMAHPADLLESPVVVKDAQGQSVTYPAAIGRAELPVLLDYFTASTQTNEMGLINLNTASIPVLTSIRGIDEPLAESIVSTRRSISAERRTSIAWLYQEELVDAALFKQRAPRRTARSLQFRFHLVAYAVPTGRFRSFEVVIDVAPKTPRILSLVELTRAGMPIVVEPATERRSVAQPSNPRGPRHG